MKKIQYLLISIFLLNLACCFLLLADEPKIENNAITINKETREVQISGHFNIITGILEFIAATNKTPRDYESLFLLDAKPSQLQEALKNIGLTTCFEKKSDCNALDIQVRWQYENNEITRSLLEFIELNQPDKKLNDMLWYFTGNAYKKDSQVLPEDTNGEILALQPGIAGIIHPSIDFGNPYDENKQKGFRISEKYFKSLIQSNFLPKAENIKQIKMVLIIKPKEARK